MVTRETNLEGGYILQCRIVDHYDAWKAVGKAFRHFSPEHILAYCFNLSTPYKMRDDMWTLLQWSVGFEWQKLSKAKRKRMISLFQRLTDLAMAAYVIIMGFA